MNPKSKINQSAGFKSMTVRSVSGATLREQRTRVRLLISIAGLTLLLQPALFARQRPAETARIVLAETVVLGDSVAAKLSGLPANRQVTVTAEMIDRAGRIWRSSADFAASASGEIDTSKHSPLAGSYSGIDPQGLFWSMQDTKEISKNTDDFDTSQYSRVTLRAFIDGKLIAERHHKRWRQKPGVASSEVRDKGIVATFYKPEGTRPAPAIILVGGSGGGIGWQQEIGATLASHGYATLALAYFGMEGVPQNLERIPLEYFQTAIEWMIAQSSVDRKRLAIVGVSKGGELSLLLASLFSQIKAVVAYVPSSVVFQSVAPSYPRTSSWSFKGSELPFVPYAMTGRFRSTRRLVDLYEDSLENRESADRAIIHVEEIQGPVLLISGRADSLWPSTRMSDQVIERLKAHKFRYSYRHVSYENAGHSISRPGYLPTADTMRNGGTAQGNAHAQASAWSELLAFLSKGLSK